MLTVKGKKMSPRMERLWRFIRDERRMQLCDWSTDEQVELEQPALRVGEAVLVARTEDHPDNRDLAHLLIDYRTIMNRRPHARASQAELDASEKKALAARAEDEIQNRINTGRW